MDVPSKVDAAGSSLLRLNPRLDADLPLAASDFSEVLTARRTPDKRTQRGCGGIAQLRARRPQSLCEPRHVE
jgi:hypothetical protein